MKIVVAADSFKGSLSSLEVAQAVEDGIFRLYPDVDVVKVGVGDGGEGTVEAILGTIGGRWQECTVEDPLGRVIKSRYGISDQQSMAIIEKAAAAGITLVERKDLNPELTSTYGVGQMIRDALSKGCRKIFMGIGGSATNDSGMGMLQALGYKFYDCEGHLIKRGCGKELINVYRIDSSDAIPELSDTELLVACDVTNEFYGEHGAAYVFAPQKGADEAMVKRLDEGLRNFAQVIQNEYGIDVQMIPGSGAAGGLGATLGAILHGVLKPGIETVLDFIDFDSKVQSADLVITGEGKMDSQTMDGKTPLGVMLRAAKYGVPSIGIAGSISSVETLLNAGFIAVYSIQSSAISLEEAMNPVVAKENISSLALNIFRTFFTQKLNIDSKDTKDK